MSDAQYQVGMKVAMGKYADSTPEEERVFEEGDVLALIEEDDENTDPANPSFLVTRASDQKQAYLFASELGAPVTDKATTTSGKKLKVKKDAKTDAAKAKAAKVKEREKAKAEKAKEREKAKVAKTKEREKAKAQREKERAAAKLKKQKEREEAKKAAEEAKRVKHSSSVTKLVKAGGNAALKAAREVAGRIASDFYLLGGLLCEIKQQAYYEVLKDEETGERMIGQPGFEHYIRQELGIEYRVAMHFVNIYEVTRRAGIPESKVKGLKYTKILPLLKLISQGAITKDGWDDWYERATTLKGEAYKEAVQQAYVDANIQKGVSRGATANQVRFTFVLFDDRAEVMNKALALAKSKLPPNDDESEHTNSEALDLIVSEWITSQG